MINILLLGLENGKQRSYGIRVVEIGIQERKTIMDFKTLGVHYDPEEMMTGEKVLKEGLDIQRVIHGPALLVLPGSLLKIHSLGPHLRPTAFSQNSG